MDTLLSDKIDLFASNVDHHDPLQKIINSGNNVSQLQPYVVQSVSNAVGEVTICHKVNSPHIDQVSNVVLNMCVTKVSSQLGPQKLKLARSSRAGFRAKDATNPCQQGDQPRDGAVYGVQHQVRPALVWRFSGGPLRSMPLGSLLHERM